MINIYPLLVMSIIIKLQGYESTQIYQVEVFTMIWHQILITNLQGNVLHLGGRINNQLLEVKRLKFKIQIRTTLWPRNSLLPPHEGKKQVDLTNQPLIYEMVIKYQPKKVKENCSLQIKTGPSLNACLV